MGGTRERGEGKSWTGTCERSDAPKLCNEVTAVRTFSNVMNFQLLICSAFGEHISINSNSVCFKWKRLLRTKVKLWSAPKLL